MEIVLTGSLGHISKPLATALIAKGHRVTVVTRSNGRIPEIGKLGAKAAVGSVEDGRFLTDTLAHADAVYCMAPPNPAHPDQIGYYHHIGTLYKEAIRAAGVKRVVHLSSYGADLPSGTGFITGSHKIEQELNSIPDSIVTHVRPTYFYYNLLAFIPMIQSAGFIGSVYGGDDRLAMVAPADIAAAVAEELEKTDGADRVRYVCSDDRPCREVAAVLGRSIGMPDLQWRVLPREPVLAALISNGVPENFALNLVELGEATHAGILRKHFEQVSPTFGTVKLESFAAEFAQMFNTKNK